MSPRQHDRGNEREQDELRRYGLERDPREGDARELERVDRLAKQASLPPGDREAWALARHLLARSITRVGPGPDGATTAKGGTPDPTAVTAASPPCTQKEQAELVAGSPPSPERGPSPRRAAPPTTTRGEPMAGTHLPDDPCLQGDEAELFRLYFRKLVRLVRYDTGVPTAVAEDCASFAFLQLCRTQPVRGERIAGWLRVTARREAYAWRRKPGRCMSLDAGANRHGSIDNGEPGATAEVVRAPVDVELALEAREALRTLASLKRRQRDTLALKVAGYSYREIQAIRAVTYTNVNRHVCEGRAAARSLRDAA